MRFPLGLVFSDACGGSVGDSLQAYSVMSGMQKCFFLFYVSYLLRTLGLLQYGVHGGRIVHVIPPNSVSPFALPAIRERIAHLKTEHGIRTFDDVAVAQLHRRGTTVTAVALQVRPSLALASFCA